MPTNALANNANRPISMPVSIAVASLQASQVTTRAKETASRLLAGQVMATKILSDQAQARAAAAAEDLAGNAIEAEASVGTDPLDAPKPQTAFSIAGPARTVARAGRPRINPEKTQREEKTERRLAREAERAQRKAALTARRLQQAEELRQRKLARKKVDPTSPNLTAEQEARLDRELRRMPTEAEVARADSFRVLNMCWNTPTCSADPTVRTRWATTEPATA